MFPGKVHRQTGWSLCDTNTMAATDYYHTCTEYPALDLKKQISVDRFGKLGVMLNDCRRLLYSGSET